MNRILPTVSAENLTQFETLALASSMNLADGHARQQLTAAQSKIVADLPNMWAEATLRPVAEIEREAAESFFGMLGQHSHPFDAGRTLSCYSSSLAMEILARSLVTTSDAVALVHPTFDNIPDILRGVGLRLVPVEEEQAHDEDLPAELLEQVGCVFITTPNNPTGRVMTEARLRRLAEQCAEYGVVLALDTCFRGSTPPRSSTTTPCSTRADAAGWSSRTPANCGPPSNSRSAGWSARPTWTCRSRRSTRTSCSAPRR